MLLKRATTNKHSIWKRNPCVSSMTFSKQHFSSIDIIHQRTPTFPRSASSKSIRTHYTAVYLATLTHKFAVHSRNGAKAKQDLRTSNNA